MFTIRIQLLNKTRIEKLKNFLGFKKNSPQKPIIKSTPWYETEPAEIIYNADYLRDETINTARGHVQSAVLMQKLHVPEIPHDFFVLNRAGHFEIGVHQQWLYDWLEIRNIKPCLESFRNGNTLIKESIANGSRSVNYEQLKAKGLCRYGEGNFSVGLLHQAMILSNFKQGNLIIRNTITDTFETTVNYCEYEGPKIPWPTGKYLRLYIREDKVFEYQTFFY